MLHAGESPAVSAPPSEAEPEEGLPCRLDTRLERGVGVPPGGHEQLVRLASLLARAHVR